MGSMWPTDDACFLIFEGIRQYIIHTGHKSFPLYLLEIASCPLYGQYSKRFFDFGGLIVELLCNIDRICNIIKFKCYIVIVMSKIAVCSLIQ